MVRLSSGSYVLDPTALPNASTLKANAALGRLASRVYAYVGLERVGGVTAYDVTNPGAPSLAACANTRSLAAVDGDRGPKGLEFVPEELSPNGKALRLVGNETSKTVTVFQVNRVQR